jgi:hypothetical protein
VPIGRIIPLESAGGRLMPTRSRHDRRRMAPLTHTTLDGGISRHGTLEEDSSCSPITSD